MMLFAIVKVNTQFLEKNAPTIYYTDYDIAAKEATRLAEVNPGIQFVIIRIAAYSGFLTEPKPPVTETKF